MRFLGCKAKQKLEKIFHHCTKTAE